MKVSPINRVQQRKNKKNMAVRNQPNFGDKKKVGMALVSGILQVGKLPPEALQKVPLVSVTAGVISTPIVFPGAIIAGSAIGTLYPDFFRNKITKKLEKSEEVKDDTK